MSTRTSRVTLQLSEQQVGALAEAADQYIRRPPPFLKRQRIVDGGLTEMHVRYGATVRISVALNWRVAPEGEALLDVVRRLAAETRPTPAESAFINEAIDELLRVADPDEREYAEWGMEPPPYDVIPNDEPARLIELLRRDRPRWLIDVDAEYLLRLLARAVPATQAAREEE